MKYRNEEETTFSNTISLFYVLIVTIFSLALFSYGFLPYKQYDKRIATITDVPEFINNVRVKSDILYKPVVQKIVIMVIDALRYDFVAGPIGLTAMPSINALIANSSSCLFKVNVQTPTVTMPRLKAITTGTIPSFIDMAFNLQSKPISTDNILLQAKRHGHKLIFYGDDTWINLFPNMFERYDGTLSFYVNDFTEVDNNVTRHLDRELNNNDWSIMILHFNGLDHIGHVMGPYHSLIKTKLKEMDDIATKIAAKVVNWNQNGEPSLFMILGDHGMKDTGGHGGATIQETSVPLVSIGTDCSRVDKEPREIEQIDITSTLAVLLGVPIPFANLGTICLDIAHSLPISRKLFILHYNAKQLLQHFKNVADYKSSNAYHKYLDAVKLHVAWLQASSHPNDMVDDIVLTYLVALKQMRETLVNNMESYDIPVMVAATIFLFHILWILNSTSCFSVSLKKTAVFAIVNNILWLVIVHKSENTALFSNNIYSLILTTLIATVFLINSYLITSRRQWCNEILKSIQRVTILSILPLGALIHAISFFGSSFIEEEHQTWYFFWGTLVTFLLSDSSMGSINNWQGNKSNAKACIKLFFILVGHRIFRTLNSTGDKFAHLPDISGWLEEQEIPIAMSFLVILALLSLIWIGYVSEDVRYKHGSLIFNTALGICIYLRHIANKSVIGIPWYPPSRGLYEVQTFWTILLIVFAYYLYRLKIVFREKKEDFLNHILFFMIYGWVAVSAVLQRPYNIILLPAQIAVTYTITAFLKNNERLKNHAFLHVMIGNTFYFYQGNSNSLATVDITSGYIGMDSHKPFVGGILVIICCISACMLSYLMFIYSVSLDDLHGNKVISANTAYLTYRLLPVTVYTIIVTIQRHHLFIWSVFSPKLLYEVAHVIIVCIVIFITSNLNSIQYCINSYHS